MGKALMFFVWNGILVFFERCLKPIKLFQHMASLLPAIVIPIIVIMMALPISHWFTDSYRNSRFYDDAVFLFPVILRLEWNNTLGLEWWSTLCFDIIVPSFFVSNLIL
jgi:hypothetical protein